MARSPLWRRIFAWTIFPVVLCSSIGGAIAVMQHGYDPEWTVIITMLVTAGLLVVAEWIQPHARTWMSDHGDTVTDVIHVAASTWLVPPTFEALFRGLLLLPAIQLVEMRGWSVWPESWPLVAQFALALVVGEFLQYWWHRLAHEHEALWRFHATHHSPRRLYWMNSMRFHPVDSMAQYTLEVTPLILLGAGAEVIALFTLATAVIGLFQHANIELRIGWLNWIFSMTELHRWHHSRNLRQGNSNYGANLIIWDVVFGTRYLPRGEAVAQNQVGLANMANFPKHYWGQLLSPFQWRKLKGERKPPTTEASAPWKGSMPKGQS